MKRFFSRAWSGLLALAVYVPVMVFIETHGKYRWDAFGTTVFILGLVLLLVGTIMRVQLSPRERKQKKLFDHFRRLLPSESMRSDEEITEIRIYFLDRAGEGKVTSSDRWFGHSPLEPTEIPSIGLARVDFFSGRILHQYFFRDTMRWRIEEIDTRRVTLSDHVDESVLVWSNPDDSSDHLEERDLELLRFVAKYTSAADYARKRLTEYGIGILERTKEVIGDEMPIKSGMLRELRMALTDGVNAVRELPGGVEELQHKYHDEP